MRRFLWVATLEHPSISESVLSHVDSLQVTLPGPAPSDQHYLPAVWDPHASPAVRAMEYTSLSFVVLCHFPVAAITAAEKIQ